MDIEVVLWIPILTAIITLLFNICFHFFKNKLDWFQDKKKFERDFSYKQLSELYLALYGVIAQSEFIRYFYKLDEKNSILELPFLEIKRIVEKETFRNDGSREYSKTEEANDITKLNKKYLVNLILEKPEYASQKLLKLAIGYRYTHDHYLKPSLHPDDKERFRISELMLIYEIVITVIKETNEKLKICKMEFNENEHDYGIMDYNLYTSIDEYKTISKD